MMRESIEIALKELHHEHPSLTPIPFHCLDGAESVAQLVKQKLKVLNLQRQSSYPGSHSVYLTDNISGTHSTGTGLAILAQTWWSW